MTSSLLFVMFALFCLILLVCLPWVSRPSAEAERMFTLVKSMREDKRRISTLERLTNLLALQTGHVRLGLGTSTNANMLKRFAEAGLRAPHTADLFLWIQILVAICGCILGSCISSAPYLWAVIGCVTGFLVPDFWLGQRQRQRRDRLRRGIPDMVDLLVICVGAGLGMDQALVRVTAEVKLSHPDLSEELERVLLERGVGASRTDAWHAMAKRVHLEEMDAFVSMLAETDRFGSPIAAALGRYSDDLRSKRRQRAEEAAAKTKVKIIFPLVLCIFPCIFLVLLVPAMLGFFHSFSSMGR